MENRNSFSAHTLSIIKILILKIPLFSILALSLVVIHIFYYKIGVTPILQIDEPLANVSLTLLHYGKLGFLTFPMQAETDSLRIDHFFNFGPWYFYIGAFFTWVFGYSIELFRSFNLWGVVLIGATALFVYRKLSMAAGMATFLIMMFWFATVHFPMVRPDIMVSVFAAIAFASAFYAITRESLFAWFLFGFATASAATTHLIAAALIPASLLFWAVSARCVERQPNDHWNSFLSYALGGIVGGAVYLFAIGFRVEELFELSTNYYASRSSTMALNYWDQLGTAWRSAWGRDFSPYMALVIGSAALTTVVMTLTTRGVVRRYFIGCVGAPLLFLVFYSMSRGFYPGGHSGYAILIDTSGAWLVGGTIASVAYYLKSERANTAKYFEIAGQAVFTIIAIGAAVHVLASKPAFTARNKTEIPHAEYVREVLSVIPEGASVLALGYFGAETGKRIQLIDFFNGEILAQAFKPNARGSIAPDYLIVTWDQPRRDLANIFGGKHASVGRPLKNFSRLFRDQTYALHSVVDSAPYGTALVYRRQQPSAISLPPSVAIAVYGGPQWQRRLSSVSGFESREVDPQPVTMTNNPYARNKEVKVPARSMEVTLPPGKYLISLNIKREKQRLKNAVDMVVALDRSNRIVDPMTGYQLFGGYTPVFPWENRSYLYYQHAAEKFLLHQFSDDEYAHVSISDIYRIDEPPSPSGPDLLPGFQRWRMVSSGPTSKLIEQSDKRIVFTGAISRWSYEFESGAISVQPNTTYKLSLPIEVENGSVGVGVLREDRKWWMPNPLLGGESDPIPGRKTVYFNTGTSKKVWIVIVNREMRPESSLSQKSTDDPPPRVTMYPGSLRALPVKHSGISYIEAIARCKRKGDDVDRTGCIQTRVRSKEK